ncbi:MAG: hypothetical protein J5537_05855 [Lachnospiraceae bacterium]|nr:hypothetical protein [Lachnospiraceae bacterium]
MKKTVLVLLTLLIIALSCIAGTINVRATKKQAMTEASYTEFERRYRADVREYLNNAGFKNAGITLTKVIDTDGRRTYTLEVHHKSFSKLDDEAKAEIISKLAELAEVPYINDTNVTTKDTEILECKFPVSDTI